MSLRKLCKAEPCLVVERYEAPILCERWCGHAGDHLAIVTETRFGFKGYPPVTVTWGQDE